MKFEEILEPRDLLKLQEEDLGADLFLYLFGYRKEGPRFDPNTQFIIKKGEYYSLPDTKTTMGNYLINRCLFTEAIFNEIGYINVKITSGIVEDVIDKGISRGVRERRIPIKPDLIRYLDNIQFFGFSINDAFGPSLTHKTVFIPEDIKNYKKQLVKEYDKDIKNGDPIKYVEMQKKLINKTKQVIGNDPGMDLYESGSKASFENNFSKLFLMAGAMQDLEKGGYHISTTAYSEGVKKEEVEHFANSATTSSYASGVGTQRGGYMTKKYMAGFQTVVLDKKGSHCNTQKLLPVYITKGNKKMFTDRYIKEGQKTVCLTDEVIDKYVNRLVQLYDPLCCVNDKICNRCAGELYYKLGITNIGLTASRISSSLMNKCLKKKHDTSLKTSEVSNLDELAF